MSVYGHVDSIDGKILDGWVFDNENPDIRCVVVMCCGEHIIAEARADMFRKDLKPNGIGDGHHAFKISIPDDFSATESVRILEKKTGFELIGSPISINGVSKSEHIEETDPNFFDLFDTKYSQEFPGSQRALQVESGHYHRISKMISEKSAAEVLTFELAQIAERMDAQGREIRQLRSLLALQSAVLSVPEQATITLPEKADLRADTFISDVKGFFGLEWSGDGVPYRWTGPERAALLDIYVARTQPVIFNLVLLKMRADGKDTECRILVDGLPIAVQVQKHGGYIIYHATLPPTDRGQKTQVCILNPALFCPGADTPTSADIRRLGVAFHRLVMTADNVSRARNREEAHNA